MAGYKLLDKANYRKRHFRPLSPREEKEGKTQQGVPLQITFVLDKYK